MNAEVLINLRKLRDDYSYYSPRVLKIKDKVGNIIPFHWNDAQVYVHQMLEKQKQETGKVRALVLKGRQQGISTYVEGRNYHQTSMQFGRAAHILTHLDKSTQAIFNMVKTYHDNVPLAMRPSTGAANANELVFNRLNSRYGVSTAGSKGVGRGMNVQLFHGCLSPDTLIVDGSDKLRPMSSFKVGDFVRTHKNNLAPISFISTKQAEVKKITLKGLTYFPLYATNEHKFYTIDGWKELSEIIVGDFLAYPVSEITDAKHRFLFKQPDTPRPQGGGSVERYLHEIEPSYELGRIAGLYLAEGSIKKQYKTGELGGVCFTVHEREVTRTLEWLNALPSLFKSTSVGIRKNSKSVNVTANGKSFAHFIKKHCGELDDKRLPCWWREAGSDFVRGLVHGYLAGDGHSSKARYDRRISASSIRSAITIGMRDALASLGYGWASITHKKAAVRNGRNEREQFTLRLSGNGVDELTKELGWYMPPRIRNGDFKETIIKDGYAWIQVKSIKEDGYQEVMDFEVNHDDHSYCTVQLATHNSEVAFWSNADEHLAGIGQAIADLPGTEIVLESTANGINKFYHMVQDAMRGIGDYQLIFVPWYWQSEYRRELDVGFIMTAEEHEYATLYGLSEEQIYWRRKKIESDFGGDVAWFDQEYPATVALAFRRSSSDSFITLDIVEAAMSTTVEDVTDGSPKIMGVDPAEYGDDATAIAKRHGRKVHPIKSYRKKGTMEVVGLVAMEADEWQPDAINVDCTGIGSGVADRLLELGYPVNRVHFGAKAMQDDIYMRRRDEMYGEMKKWLQNTPCELPNDEILKGDMVACAYTYDSSRRLVIESKEKLKERGLPSPDRSDAVALTFAVNIAPKRKSMPRRKFNWKAGV